AAPLNPNGRPNADVVVPWVNGLDVTRRPRGMWIIDFGVEMPLDQAACYEAPFQYVLRKVKPEREGNNRAAYRERWWLHVEPRPALRAATESLPRYIATTRVAKHRVFVWLAHPTLPDSRLFAFARPDDYFLGVLQSRLHEAWSLKTGSTLEDRPFYTPTTCFDTFPFPWPPGAEPAGDPRVEAIASAARELVCLRDRWLNPEGTADEELKKRTLTNLYNARPEWLRIAHRRLDDAVLDAYGWPRDLPDDAILECLLALNHQRSALPV
ncbi:MAG TPA: type IIL restriction-modification enzyme MmeI, partial [Chloroflexota bacterium]|nr:type IIL restriction-modification enzyme MmeI [Chloroflexota bacterium]